MIDSDSVRRIAHETVEFKAKVDDIERKGFAWNVPNAAKTKKVKWINIPVDGQPNAAPATPKIASLIDIYAIPRDSVLDVEVPLVYNSIDQIVLNNKKKPQKSSRNVGTLESPR